MVPPLSSTHCCFVRDYSSVSEYELTYFSLPEFLLNIPSIAKPCLLSKPSTAQSATCKRSNIPGTFPEY